LEAAQREPVISLASIRRLQRTIRDLNHGNSTRQLLVVAHAVLLEAQASTAGWLLDRVERVVAEVGDAPVEELTRQVARDWDFRRVSRSMRHSKAQWGALAGDGEEIPHVDVGPHVRQGRPVRGYSRYVGYEHLRGLPGLAGRPQVVQQVVRCLIEGRHRRHGNRNPA